MCFLERSGNSFGFYEVYYCEKCKLQGHDDGHEYYAQIIDKYIIWFTNDTTEICGIDIPDFIEDSEYQKCDLWQSQMADEYTNLLTINNLLFDLTKKKIEMLLTFS